MVSEMGLAGVVLAGRYRLERILGSGAMGEVWLGHDLSPLQREVAVKVLTAPSDSEHGARFHREAAILARMQHPGITVVHDVGDHEGHRFIVMELLRGSDLARLLAEHGGALPMPRAVELSRQIMVALAAAHGQGVIHRDLKPSNVFVLGGDQVKICDFGIARSANETSDLTGVGMVIGTPAYMSPEQCRAGPVDARTDLYAAGCVMFELLTGRPPFMPDQSLYTLLRQHAEEVPPRPSALRPQIPERLDRLVVGLLAKNPVQRPEASTLIAALTDLAAHPPRTERPSWHDAPTFTGNTSAAMPSSAFGHRPGPVPGGQPAPPGRTPNPQGDPPRHLRLRLEHKLGLLVNSLVYSPDGQVLAGCGGTTIGVWDAHTAVPRRQLAMPSGTPHCLAFSPNGLLLACGSGQHSVHLWDAHTGEPRLSIRHTPSRWQSQVFSVAFSPDGGLLASAGDDKAVRVWNLATGHRHLELLLHTGPVHSVAFSPDGRALASGGKDRAVRIWDAGSGEQRLELTAHGGARPRTFSVAFSPDGGLLASGGDDKAVRVWTLATGAQCLELTGHRAAVRSVAFSPDGRWLASGADDKTVQIWDVYRGQEVARLTGHGGAVRSVAFSPDGRSLASAGGGRLGCVWSAG